MSHTDAPSPRIEDVLFAVDERPVSVNLAARVGGAKRDVSVPRYRAIVDVDRDEILSIVSADYRLVTNREAIDIGGQCFRRVFGSTSADDMVLFNVIQPATRSFCHIDYVSARDRASSPSWMAFLRITNSYNRMYPLRFDVGFCRMICRNGVIFGKDSVEFRYPHTHRDVRRSIEFQFQFTNLDQLRERLGGWIQGLQKITIARGQIPLLTCRALGLKLDSESWNEPKRLAKLREFVKHVNALGTEYVTEMGSNAYAAFNVMTDVASRPNVFGTSPIVIHRWQRKAATWAEQTVQASLKADFRIEKLAEPTSFEASLLAAASNGDGAKR